MIICVCRRLNDAKVSEAIAAGARSPESVQAHHGCAFNCGKCRVAIGEMIAEHSDKSDPAPALMAAE
ncbi:MAG: (2Fe-2S)-binding protein [Pseudomonadota bacterium]